jgi:hypothetical protein
MKTTCRLGFCLVSTFNEVTILQSKYGIASADQLENLQTYISGERQNCADLYLRTNSWFGTHPGKAWENLFCIYLKVFVLSHFQPGELQFEKNEPLTRFFFIFKLFYDKIHADSTIILQNLVSNFHLLIILNIVGCLLAFLSNLGYDIVVWISWAVASA